MCLHFVPSLGFDLCGAGGVPETPLTPVDADPNTSLSHFKGSVPGRTSRLYTTIMQHDPSGVGRADADGNTHKPATTIMSASRRRGFIDMDYRHRLIDTHGNRNLQKGTAPTREHHHEWRVSPTMGMWPARGEKKRYQTHYYCPCGKAFVRYTRVLPDGRVIREQLDFN